jgi:hypothetical protein
MSRWSDLLCTAGLWFAGEQPGYVFVPHPAYAGYQYDPAQAHGGKMVNGTLVMPAPAPGPSPAQASWVDVHAEPEAEAEADPELTAEQVVEASA